MVFPYLKRHLFSVVIASFLAIVLALVSAAVFSLIGPTLQILMAPDLEVLFSLEDLFGARLSSIMSWLTGVTMIKGADLWSKLPGLLIGLAFLRAIFGLSQWFLWERASELAARAIRSDLVSKFLFLNPVALSKDEKELEASLSSGLTTDLRLTREYIVHFYGGLPRELLQVIAYMITLILLSPELFLLFFVGIIPAVGFTSKWGKKLKKRASRALQDYSTLTEWIQQRLLGIETIKHYRAEEIESKKMFSLTEGLFYRFLKAARVKARTSPMLEFVAIFSMVLVLYYALVKISEIGQGSGGIYLSFFSTLAVLSQSTGKIGRYFNSNREGNAAQSRLKLLFEYFDNNQKKVLTSFKEGCKAPTVLSAKDVTVRYPNSNTSALSSFTYDFESGKIYCLCGPSGAGKSTFIKVVLGLVQIREGGDLRAFCDGEQGKIGYMPQQVQLAPATVGLNVAYPDMEFDRVRVLEALKKVDLEDFVLSLEDGVDTVLGKEGKGISGGQAQRLLLARLLYHRPSLVLVDEGTSSLDPETEDFVYTQLRELAEKGTTIILIAHRLSAIQFADQVLLFDKGRLLVAGEKGGVVSSKEFKDLIGNANYVF